MADQVLIHEQHRPQTAGAIRRRQLEAQPVSVGKSVKRRRGVIELVHHELELGTVPDRVTVADRGQRAQHREVCGVAGDTALRFVRNVFRARADRTFARRVREERITHVHHVTHRHFHGLPRVGIRWRIEERRAQAPDRVVRLDAQIVAAGGQDPGQKLEVDQLVVLVVVTDFRGVLPLGVFHQARPFGAGFLAEDLQRAGDIPIEEVKLEENQLGFGVLVLEGEPLPAVLALVGVVKVFDVVGGPENRLPEGHRRGVFPVAGGVGNDFSLLTGADVQGPNRNTVGDGLAGRGLGRRQSQYRLARLRRADNEIAGGIPCVELLGNLRVPGRFEAHFNARLRRIDFFFDDVESDGRSDLARRDRIGRREPGGRVEADFDGIETVGAQASGSPGAGFAKLNDSGNGLPENDRVRRLRLIG